MRADEYQQYDALGLAGLVRSGEVTAREICETAMAIIDGENAAVNAVVETCYGDALAGIEALPDGPLYGVPWLVKDFNTLVRGMHDTNGSRALRHRTAAADGELVSRHRRAGLVLLGKTNTPEFGMNVCTSPTLFGPTRHPMDHDFSVGGSSGGSAAAVAAGMLPAAHATDSGGSIRIPASNCGLFGLKPSRNRIPLGNNAAEGLAGLSTAHGLTHSVRDSAMLLDLCQGALTGDAMVAPPHERVFMDALESTPGELKVGLLTTGLAGEVVHEDCVHAAVQTGAMLENLGHRVETVAAPVDGELLRRTLDVIFAVNIAWVVSLLPQGFGAGDLEHATVAAVRRAEALSGVDYVHAQHGMRLVTTQLARFFQSHDLLLSPTLAHPVRPIGYHDPDEGNWERYLNRMLDDIPFTPLFNVSGGPAVSLPAHRCQHGLPIGVQLGAEPGMEALLLAVSRQLEIARPWHQRK